MKGVGMIRAEIGLKNRQIINEAYSFFVVILKIDIKYTFPVRFHIFSRNDRLVWRHRTCKYEKLLPK
jgi:hypothetical protein